jgi:hypothetical protein
MRSTAVAGSRSSVAGAVPTTYARSRALLAAVIVAAVFAIGMLTGLAVSPTLRSAAQPAAVGLGASSQAVAQAHLAWLRSEHDSYGSSTLSPATVAQAHLAWLRSEHDSYGSSTLSPAGNLGNWIDYRQFRLSEEGYGL